MATRIKEEEIVEEKTPAKRDSRARLSRDATEHYISDSRTNEEYESWFGPQGALQAPPPRQGYEQRWVRIEVGNQSDPSNYQRKHFQHKWEPRKVETIPDEYRMYGSDQTMDGTIKIRGMILCERPKAIGDKHREYIRQQAQGQKARVVSDLNKSAYVMKGMQPYVAEDKTNSYVRDMAVANDNE